MDRTPRPNHPRSFFILPMHLRLEVSQMPIPAGLTPPPPPPPLSLYPSSLSLPMIPCSAPGGQFSQRSGQASSDGGECSLGSSALWGRH